MTCDLQSPDNADTASWNNYPLDAEEQLRSLAERKRIVVPRGTISALFADGGDMSLDGVDTPYYSIFES